MSETGNSKFLDKMIEVSGKFANNRYVKAIQGGFSADMPLMILASIATLLSALVFNKGGIMSGFIAEETLASIRTIFSAISNGTNNIISLVLACGIGYYLAKDKEFKNLIGVIVMNLSIMIIIMPLTFSATIGETTGAISGFISYNYTGTNGILVGMLVGCLGTNLFIYFSTKEKLKIKMPDSVPNAIATGFNVLIPTCLTGLIIAVISYLFNLAGTNIYQAVMTAIQTPLKGLATSAAGFTVVSAIALFTFTLGVHSSVINGVVLRPFLSANFAENAAAVAAGEIAPNIISDAYMAYYQRMGGAGCTLALVIAIFLFSRRKQNREIAKIGGLPSLFNIGEPMIFGMPIMLNPLMMIPFVLAPIFNIIFCYIMTAIHFVNPLAIYTPSTTPIILSGFLASAGDLKVVLLQIICLVVDVLIYGFFLKLYERTLPEDTDNK